MSELGTLVRGRRLGRLLVVAVFLLGLLVSGFAALAVGRAEHRYAGKVMDSFADDANAAIIDRVNRYSENLSDLAAAVGAHPDLSSADFSRMTSGLTATRLPGASGVALVVAATTPQIAAMQAIWRGRGDVSLILKPSPSSATQTHAFVIYGRQFDGSATTIGLDVDRVPATMQALLTARHSGALAISQAHVLLRDQNLSAASQQTSVVLAAPVYTGDGDDAGTGTFAGWVVMGLRGTDFLTRTPLVRDQGAVKIVLDDPATPGKDIGKTFSVNRLEHDDSLVRERTVTVGQRTWHLTLYPTARLVSRVDRWLSILTGAAGMLITVLLAIMTVILTSSRDRALAQVAQATAAHQEDIDRRTTVEAQLREREEQLRHLAFQNGLTGLANRVLFYDRVSHALRTHARAGRTFAVLFIDLDGFKQVNDQWGHAAGDHVLRAVADRLRAGLRDSDTVARFGGDEFALLIENLSDAQDAPATAARIVASTGQPIDIGGHTVTVTASVGIALNNPGDSADDILREADFAMYTAKTSDKSRYVIAVGSGSQTT